jgi:hypothetical protein
MPANLLMVVRGAVELAPLEVFWVVPTGPGQVVMILR